MTSIPWQKSSSQCGTEMMNDIAYCHFDFLDLDIKTNEFLMRNIVWPQRFQVRNWPSWLNTKANTLQQQNSSKTDRYTTCVLTSKINQILFIVGVIHDTDKIWPLTFIDLDCKNALKI